MPIRRRLTISYVGFFAVALLALDIGLYMIVRQALIIRMENELQLAAQLVQQDFTDSNEALLTYFGARGLRVSLSDFGATNLVAQVFEQDKTLYTKSSNLSKPLQVDQTLLQAALDGKK